MSRGGLLRWTARRLPGVPPATRDDLIEAVDEIADHAPRADRILELASLVGFALRTASRRGAADDRREMIRQGVWVGALVLGITAGLRSWAGIDRLRDVLVAVLATMLAAATAGGLRIATRALAGAGVVAAVAIGGDHLDARHLVLMLVVLAAVAVGRPYDARPCGGGAALAGVATLAGGAVTMLLPPLTATGSIEVAAAVVPVLLLAIGWFDPRYAVAATVVWFWRFVAVDVADLATAVNDVGDRVALRGLLVRWLLMGAGVLVAWHVADAALRRCLRTPA